MELEDGLEVVVTKARCCYVPPNIKHRIKAMTGENTSIVMIIPGSNDFPGAYYD